MSVMIRNVNDETRPEALRAGTVEFFFILIHCGGKGEAGWVSKVRSMQPNRMKIPHSTDLHQLPQGR